jgi:CheY-like chemotaxis protein
VTSFNNPQEAAEAFRQAPASFDLVLTDLTMPNMSGVALAREVRQLRKDLPIVLSTGFAGQSNREEFDSVGIGYLLDKPYNVEELTQTIAKALSRKP